MITTGIIKILDSNNEVQNEWKLENVTEINGHALLYNQLESGYYARELDGVLYVEELKPQMSKGGLPIIVGTLVNKSDNWIHSEEL